MSDVEEDEVKKVQQHKRSVKEFKRPAMARYRTLQGYSAKTKGKYSKKAISKRRQAFFTTGKGGQGLLVRSSRIFRHLKRIRDEANEEYNNVAGDYFKGIGKRKAISKAYIQTISAANDALANRIMALAYDFAVERNGGKKEGLTLLNRDLDKAWHWNSILSRRQ